MHESSHAMGIYGQMNPKKSFSQVDWKYPVHGDVMRACSGSRMLLLEDPSLDETPGLETNVFTRWKTLPLWLFECLWALALKVWTLLPVIELALACNYTKEGCVR